jgi:hypothetical protein
VIIDFFRVLPWRGWSLLRITSIYIPETPDVPPKRGTVSPFTTPSPKGGCSRWACRGKADGGSVICQCFPWVCGIANRLVGVCKKGRVKASTYVGNLARVGRASIADRYERPKGGKDELDQARCKPRNLSTALGVCVLPRHKAHAIASVSRPLFFVG